MPRTIEISTHLDAPPKTVSAQIMRPALLLHVSAPLLHFKPIDPPELPETWRDGEYRVGMWLFGVLPIGTRESDAIRC